MSRHVAADIGCADLAILLPDLGGGGAERVAVNLANEFDRRGLRVQLLLMGVRGALLPALRPSVCVVDLNAARIRDVLRPLLRYLRATPPRALLACMWPLTALALGASRLAGGNTRVVVAEHTSWSTADSLGARWHRPLLRQSMRWLFPGAGARIAVSAGAAEDLAALSGLSRTGIDVIHNPVHDVHRAPPMHGTRPPQSWWTGSHKRLLAVGALKPAKDYPTLLRALAVVRRQQDVRLLILGEGPCRAELEKQIGVLGLEAVVDLPGFVEDPRPWLAHAHLHVLSSRTEGLGNVLVEAMAAGTPVVSTDCRSGPGEILQQGRLGPLVPVADPVALAGAMRSALASPVDAGLLRARAADFSIGRAADRYAELLFAGDGANDAAHPLGSMSP